MNTRVHERVPEQLAPVNTLTNEALALTTLTDDSSAELQLAPEPLPPTPQQSTSFISFLWSPVASLFGINSKPTSPPAPIEAPEKTPEEEKKKKTYSDWFGQLVQKFGADAGKTMSDTLKGTNQFFNF
jgi:hypothetical protein